MSGGFSETRLSETSYVVRFGVNVFTPPDKVGQLLLRRAAELTLEHDRRYFLVTSPQTPPDRGSSEITIRFLDEPADSPDAVDSTVVIDETAHVAQDRLSPNAAKAYRRLTGRDPS